MVSLFGTSGDTFNRSQVDGTLNANGMQVGGTSYSYADDSGVVLGGTGSTYQQTGFPTSTSIQVFVGNYGDDSLADLESNPTAAPTGTSRRTQTATRPPRPPQGSTARRR